MSAVDLGLWHGNDLLRKVTEAIKFGRFFAHNPLLHLMDPQKQGWTTVKRWLQFWFPMIPMSGDKNDGQNDPPRPPLPERVQFVLAIAGCISVVLLSAAAAYRLATCELNFAQFDFSQLLSLALAIFSVGLSTAFYFKATDTSNKFYDRTFGHTKDLIQALVRIEERFGQMLKDIHEDTAATRHYSQSKNEVREIIETTSSTELVTTPRPDTTETRATQD